MSEPMTFNADELKQFIKDNMFVALDINCENRIVVKLQFHGDDQPFTTDSISIPTHRSSYE